MLNNLLPIPSLLKPSPETTSMKTLKDFLMLFCSKTNNYKNTKDSQVNQQYDKFTTAMLCKGELCFCQGVLVSLKGEPLRYFWLKKIKTKTKSLGFLLRLD